MPTPIIVIRVLLIWKGSAWCGGADECAWKEMPTTCTASVLARSECSFYDTDVQSYTTTGLCVMAAVLARGPGDYHSVVLQEDLPVTATTSKSA